MTLAGRIDKLESKMEARFNSLDASFDGLQRTLIGSMATVVLAFALRAVFGG